MQHSKSGPWSGRPMPPVSTRRSLAADQSSNIMEILRGDEGATLPPEPPQARVRNLGRTIKERVEVCQWIKDMKLEPAAPKLNLVSDLSGGRVIPKVAKTEEVDETSNAVAQTKVSRAIGDTALVKISSSRVRLDADMSAAEPGVKSAGLREGRDATEEPSLEEQLSIIRQQQSQLLEQQKVIQQAMQLGCQKQPGDRPANEMSDYTVSCSEAVTTQGKEQELQTGQGKPEEGEAEQTLPSPIQSNDTKIETKRRRLKGSLASQYARRDEGTVGSLLWKSEDDVSARICASASNCDVCRAVTTVSDGREANLRQEDSSSISQLLSQTSFLESRSFHDSENTETV